MCSWALLCDDEDSWSILMTEQDRKDAYGWFSGYSEFTDAGSKPHLLFWFKPLWSVNNYTSDPLTYHHPDGYKLRPNNKFTTDFGSVPFLAQTLIPRIFSSFRWRKSYEMHDSAYMEGGLWYAEEGSEDYTLLRMTRSHADDMLSMWIKAEGGNVINSAPIWFGVKIGGWASWGKKDLKKEKA